MRRIREVLRLRAELGPNVSAIAAGARLARSTVRAYLDRAEAAGVDAAAAELLLDVALEAALFRPALAAPKRALPDWAAVDQELRRHKHVTRKLLWMEYKAADPVGLGFSQFKQRLSDWQKASGRGLSMRQVHHAGETVQMARSTPCTRPVRSLSTRRSNKTRNVSSKNRPCRPQGQPPHGSTLRR